MTPRCLGEGCGAICKPVARPDKPPSRLGRRMVDGVEYCWFCSRACAGRDQGARVAKTRRYVQNFAMWPEWRARTAIAERRVEFSEDLALLRRYGVPAGTAEALLDRMAQRFDSRGYNRAWHRYARKPA